MDRRLFYIGVAGCVSVIALVSCRASIPRLLPPYEVLRKTIATNASLLSVSYRVDSSLQTSTSSGTMVGSGALYHGGSSWFLNADVHLVDTAEQSVRKLSMNGEFISPFPGTIYYRLHTISGMLADALPPKLREDILSWNFIGSGSGTTLTAQRDSIDPAAIENLLSHLDVTDSKGIERSQDGTYQYHLFVRTKTGSALPLRADGELFIDARTFTLTKAHWHLLTDIPDVLLDFSVQFFHQITVPSLPDFETTGKEISLDTILNIIFPSSLLPSLELSGDTTLHND